MPKNENQIKTPLPSQMASHIVESPDQQQMEMRIDWGCAQELLAANAEWLDSICNHCHWPAAQCDCSRYDSEGNEL